MVLSFVSKNKTSIDLLKTIESNKNKMKELY
jgi:hypothetical protein